MTPAAAFATLFLALSEADQPLLAWWVITALVASGPAAYYWVKLWDRFHPGPGDQTKLATKDELAAAMAGSRQELKDAEARMAATHKMEMQTVLSQLQLVQNSVADMAANLREVFGELRSLHRSLGRAEGKIASEE
ncbi:MAG TPA: hypothetical protein VGE39_02485 [Prosthecobacter sp.]